MKIRNILAYAACATLIGSPFVKVLAEDPTPAPAPAAEPAKEPGKKPEAKPVDPERAKMIAARKKAMEDPEVKAALDEARKAQMEADKKMNAKIREIDPSLAPVLDKMEEKMKAREPKPKAPKDKEAMPKKGGDKGKKDEKKPDDKKPADKPADQ